MTDDQDNNTTDNAVDQEPEAAASESSVSETLASKADTPRRGIPRNAIAAVLILSAFVVYGMQLMRGSAIEIPPFEQTQAVSDVLIRISKILEQPAPPSLTELDPPVARLIYEAVKVTATNREKHEAWGQLAKIYHAHGFKAQAVAAYEKAAELRPQSALWPYLMGLIEWAEGDFAKARELFNDAAVVDDQNPIVWLRIGQCCLELDDLDCAEKAFVRYVDRMPSLPIGHVGLGMIAMKRGDAANAIKHFAEAVKHPSADAKAHTLLSEAYRASGETDKADQHAALAEALPTADEINDPLFTQIKKLNANRAILLTQFGAALKQNNLSGALTIGEQLIENDPSDPSLWLTLSDVYRMAARYDEAINAAHQARVRDAANPTAYLQLAKIHTARQEYDQALRNADIAVALAPNTAEVHGIRATIYQQAGHKGEALRSMYKAIELSPDELKFQITLGLFLQEDGKLTEALAVFEKCRALAPEQPGISERIEQIQKQLTQPTQ